MREALEIPRAIHHGSTQHGIVHGEPDGSMSSMTIMDFHLVLMAWLEYAGHKLLHLSHSSYDTSAWDSAQIGSGELAVVAGVKSVGFSRARFGFWVKRIGELAQHDNKEVKAAFQRCYHLADVIVKEVNDHRAEDA